MLANFDKKVHKPQYWIEASLSPAGGLGGLYPPQFLAKQLTLSQPGGTDYVHRITTCTPGFSDLPMDLFQADKRNT